MLGTGVAIRGERRFGGFAIASGVLGFAIAYFATVSSLGKLESVVVWSALFAAMLRFATPLTFAALGGMFSERSGVVNIGLEGMMSMGAFFANLAGDKFDSWWLGLLVGIASGGAAALVHAVFSIHLRADQIISGTAINLLALGVTGYLFIDIYGTEGTPTDIESIPNVHLGFLGDGFLGDVFGRLNLMIWIAIVLVPLTWAIMFKTPIGLRIRACGEHPRAADTVGINVYAVRYGAVVVSGMLAAAGGAYLSIGFLNSFNENMTAGRGFIALAALIFGNWRPSARQRRACCSASRRRSPSGCPVLAVRVGALPGAAVRPDPDRRGRRDRPLDPAGGRRPAVPEAVMSAGVVAGSEAGTGGNARALASVLLGLLAVATMPLAILATRYSDSFDLLHAGFAIPVAIVFGALALVLARRAQRHDDVRLGRAGGRGAARLGRALGVLGIALAATCLVALSVYGILRYLGER